MGMAANGRVVPKPEHRLRSSPLLFRQARLTIAIDEMRSHRLVDEGLRQNKMTDREVPIARHEQRRLLSCLVYPSELGQTCGKDPSGNRSVRGLFSKGSNRRVVLA